MTYLILVPVAAIVLTILLGFYLRYARSRVEIATRLWPLVEQSASKLISEKVPPPVREMAFRLGITTGCGCYAAGVIVHHYVPSVLRRVVQPDRCAEELAMAVKSLDAAQKRQLDTLIAAALAYDAAANPIIGFVAHRVIKFRAEEARKPQDLPSPTREARQSVIETLGSKSARRHERELCMAA